jgi:hypothetical protein
MSGFALACCGHNPTGSASTAMASDIKGEEGRRVHPPKQCRQAAEGAGCLGCSESSWRHLCLVEWREQRQKRGSQGTGLAKLGI